MKLHFAVLCLAVLFQDCVAPPVTANKKEDSKDNEVDGAEHKGADWDVGLEYNRYLQEVVQALESDPQFRDKLEKAEVADIRTGKIASELEFVNHNVRSKLDELKRTELERLRHLAIKQAELQRQQEQHHEQGSNGEEEPGHLDHENPHTFEVEDLKKLIVKTTKDLEEADRKRREEFKEYEMQKEFEKQQQLNLLDEQHKKEMEQKIKEQEEKHRQHPNLNHPGSKHQLEEVWEEQDHMNPEDFNPKTFFYLHDLDGNGYWDADEVKALFQKELDKMYDPNAPEDDMRERREEMERMREHVFNETDVNRDRMISYQEFLDQTKKQEFEQDQGWESLDKDKVYTHEEYEQFEKRRQAEIQQMVQQGLLPPAPDLHLPYGMQVPPEYLQQQHQQNLQYQQQHHQIPPHAQPQYHPQGGAPMHPNQVPQYHGGASPQGYHPPPQYQHQQGYQPPAPQAFHAQQQGHPNNIPQGHPNQQMHPNDIPMQGHPNIPQQHQNIQGGHPNMPPQQHQQGIPQQGHPNMPPQQHQQGIPQQGHPNIPPQQGHPNIPPQQGHPNIPPPQNHPNIPPPQQQHQNIPPQNHPNSQGHPNNPPVQEHPVNPPQQASQEHQNVPVHHNSQEPAASQPVHHNSEQKHDSKEPQSHN